MIYNDVINYGKGWNNVSDKNRMETQDVYRGEVSRVKIGEAVAKNDLLYPVITSLGTVKEWKQANAALASTMPALAIALEDGATGDLLRVLHRGYIKDKDFNYGTLATGTVAIAGTVVEGDKIVLGPLKKPVCFMFTVAAGTSSKAKVKATATLSTTGVAIAGEKITIGETVFEVTTTGAISTGSHYAIDCSAGLTQTAFENAIMAALDQAIAERALDISYVAFTSNDCVITLGGALDSYIGLEQNLVATTETCTNAAFGATTFLGGVPAVDRECVCTLAISTAKTAFVTQLDLAIAAGLDITRASEWSTNDMVLTAGTRYHKGYAGNNLTMLESDLAGTLDAGTNITVSGAKFTGGKEGGVLYSAASKGLLTLTEPGFSQKQVVGYAIESDKFFFNPMPVEDKTLLGPVLAAEHGAGAVGTAFAPRTYRKVENGNIITEIHVDLTGLACKGDAAKDAIGLAAGGAAFIGQYVVATYGVVYRVEMVCLETPGQGTATITTDIDLGAEDGANAYDESVDDVVINTGGLAAGRVYSTDIPSLTADDYLYLVEGDTAAATGVYNAGQLVIRLFGKPVIAH